VSKILICFCGDGTSVWMLSCFVCSPLVHYMVFVSLFGLHGILGHLDLFCTFSLHVRFVKFLHNNSNTEVFVC
jgi:hypothetical protein